MTRIELSSITCRPCGTALKPDRFPGRCPTCGRDRFDVRVRRSFRGFDWRGSAGALGFVLELAALPFPFILADWAAGDAYPLYVSRSEDDLGDLPWEEVSKFLALPNSGRHDLFVQWKRRQAEASRPVDHQRCGRCGLGFTPYPNAWHRKGFCSRKCFEVSKIPASTSS